MANKKSFLKVDLIFGVATLVFIVLIFLTFKSAQQVEVGKKLEERTYHILGKLEQLLSQTLEIETANRGYAISGNEEFLAPVEIRKASLTATVDSLRHLILDPEQMLRLDTLDILVKKKIAFGDSIVWLGRTKGLNHAMKLISQGRGRQIMDSIRGLCVRATSRELVLLSERSAQTQKKRTERGLYFTLISFAAFLLAIVAYLVIRANLKRLMQNREIQEELIEALSYQNKKLQDFAQVVSNNVRAPITSIATISKMAKTDITLDEYHSILDKIEKVTVNVGETMGQLIDDLSVNRNTNIDSTTVSFQEIFLEEKDNLQDEISKSKAEIYYDFGPAPTVRYSKKYLENIMHTLLANALKHRSSDRRPIIHLRSEKRHGNVFLFVSDNGVGIDLEKFGDRLFRLRKTFGLYPASSGIGLFMTKVQIESFGGKIEVQSKVGEGTTFAIKF